MSEKKHEKKTEEIEEVVSRLFASKGYHATSMRDIAHELNINKSTLYYYVESKEGILFKLLNDNMDAALHITKEICERNIAPEEKLDKILRFYIRHYGNKKEALKLLLTEVDSLNDEHKKIMINKERRLVKIMQAIFENLITNKQMTGIPPAVGTFAFFGMVHYTVWWYNKEGPVSVEDLASIFLKIFTKGIFGK